MNIREAQLYQAIADTEVSFGCEKEFNILFDTKDEEIVGVTFQFIVYEDRLWDWVHEKREREAWMYSSFRDKEKDTILERKFSWKELCEHNPHSIETWIVNMAHDMEKECRR